MPCVPAPVRLGQGRRLCTDSEEVAPEMAIGALKASRADLAVANTGVADDSGEDPGGTQCHAYTLMRKER